jgi:hypothetical protein
MQRSKQRALVDLVTQSGGLENSDRWNLWEEYPMVQECTI